MSNEEIVQYIKDFIDKNGYSPSVRELTKAAGFKSTSTMYYRLERIRAEGKITWVYGINRTIRPT